MSYHTTAEVKAQLIDMIPAAAAHNRIIRPNPTSAATVAMFDRGRAALVAALYVEIDERFSRRQVEEALRELSLEGRVYIYPESAQWDLTEYDRDLAIVIGCQPNHWIEMI